MRKLLIWFGVGLGSLAIVPPFSYSISSALSGLDSSVMGHEQAIDKGTKVVTQNPLGLGLGQADHFGAALSSSDGAGQSAGVGENIYLALFVSVGPLGFLMFAAWVLGLIRPLLGGRDPTAGWIAIAVGCALVGYLVGGMFASPLMRFTTSSTVWLTIGMTIGVLSSTFRNAIPAHPNPAFPPGSSATNLPPDRVKQFLQLGKQIDDAGIQRFGLGPPYSVHPPTGQTGGIYTLRLNMDKVAALSIKVFGGQSTYPQPSP